VEPDLPYTWRSYFDWAESIDADYVALPDAACEPSLHPSEPIDRVYHSILWQYEAYQDYLHGDYSFDVVPVLQGWEARDYRLCARWMESQGLKSDYAAIGTVCKRRRTDPICHVLSVLEQEWPDTEWHLFGATLRVWKDDRLRGRFRSADTAAWNWGASSTEEKKELYNEYKQKVENTHRDFTQEIL